MILEIVKYGKSALRKRCRPVNSITDYERKLFDNMAQTMYQAQGIGLAASQVGEDIQLLVLNNRDNLIKLANPKILRRRGKITLEEGCLSVPDIIVKVKRAKNINVSGLNEKGEKVNIDAEGLLACIIQHECDHLQGKLIIDYLSFPRRIMLRKKLKSIKNKQ